MTLAYACVLIAALLPYVWTMVAKAGGKKFDNRDPRQWLEKQENPRVRRADAAQKNAFEAFPAFAAGVVMAQLAGVDHGRIALLAVAFVIFRILHGVFYLADVPLARSAAWTGGMACVASLLVLAALNVA